MKIIVDAMGGDNAPLEIIKGALEAAEEFGVELLLVGRGEEILKAFKALGYDNLPAGVEISNAAQVITMEDPPAAATRTKRDSSMSIALTLLKDGAGDAAVSAGSTGALLSGATLITKRIRGIRRAALAPVLPAKNGGTILIDCGANAECTSEYLVQFAYMGSCYSANVLGRENPTVGLLNIGAEESKGTSLQKETWALLQSAKENGKLNFVGNVEGRDIMEGTVDVVVCDGFSGNIALKSMEGMGLLIGGLIKDMFFDSTKGKVAALALKNELKALKAHMDYNEVGGTILLGISKPVIKAHGSCKARAFRSAIKQAVDMAEAGVIEKISDKLADMKENVSIADK